ncbi:unnamed protein product [Caenorhabditis auriculariae]|uniref:Uncharacterized protein n=1 Tax=Caenorhabditis auriculariae TaxID=2777116 RepID=A0A8S1HN47_9PELO|nr:unnamed protein product [Caenorhabditis auriculariae]
MSLAELLSSENFFYMTYFNKTDAFLNDDFEFYRIYWAVELTVTSLSIPYFVLICYLNITTNQNHRNMRLIYDVYFFHYFFYAFSRIFQITASTLVGYNLETEFPIMLLITSYVRSLVAAIAFLIISAFTFERACATYFVGEYEARRHSWIFKTVYITLLIVGNTTAIWLHIGTIAIKIGLLSFVLLINAATIVANYHIHQINERYFEESHGENSCRTYSLAERYQISENIRTCKTFSQVFKCIIVVNVSAVSALAYGVVATSPRQRNLAAAAFDGVAQIYVYAVPTVALINSHLWKQKLFRGLAKLRLPSDFTTVGPLVQIESTFGDNLNIDKSRHSQQYFDMLKESWDRPPRLFTPF